MGKHSGDGNQLPTSETSKIKTHVSLMKAGKTTKGNDKPKKKK